MFTLITHLIIILGLIMGSATDLKIREVPDWLNYALIGAGLGLGLLATLISWSWQPLACSILGYLAGMLIGYLMFYTGQWGGGDAKLIMGLGALFGLSLGGSGLPLFVIFLINTLFAGALIGILWAIFLAATHWNKTKTAFKVFIHQQRILRIRKWLLGLIALLIIAAIIARPFLFELGLIILAALLFFTFYLWVISKVVEQSGMLKELPTSKLTEGDWVAKAVWVPASYRSVIDEQRRQQTTLYQEALRYDERLRWMRQLGCKTLETKRQAKLEAKHLPSERAIIDRISKAYTKQTGKKLPTAVLTAKNKTAFDQHAKHLQGIHAFLKEYCFYDPAQTLLASDQGLGLTIEQLEQLKKHKVKHVLVKEGVPFVPSFALAYIATMLLGNWLALLL